MTRFDDTIYLDNNATTQVDPRVTEAMVECQRVGSANPASQHAAGREARRQLETARDQICGYLGGRLTPAAADRVILTSGGTEANNLALRGLVGEPPGRIVVSAVEHPSVHGPAAALDRLGFDVVRLPVDPDGVVCWQQLPDLLTPDTRLVSVMLANHETGALQPVRRIAKLCETAGVCMHTDAVQAVGKIDVDFRALGVNAMTVSAHKFHGPVGVGALLLQSSIHVDPLLLGGLQQWGYRPGTESLSLAIGLERALALWQREAHRRYEQLATMRDRFERLVTQRISQVVVNGQQAQRVPHTANISFSGIDRQLLFMALDQAGVFCSTGSACASGSSEPSPVLRAMGLSDALVEAALRFSVSSYTSAPDVDLAVDRIVKICNHLRGDSRGKKKASSPRQEDLKTL